MLAEEEIIEIIQRKLEGNLTPNEAEKIDQWLAVPENVDEYAKYEMIWQMTSSINEKQESFTPNSSKSWSTIEQQIVAESPKRKFKLAYAAAASIALIFMLLGANYIFNTNSNDGSLQLVLESNEKDTLMFSDGSMAYLVGPCTIAYPEEFASDERIITMDGFAYFDIAHDNTRPFEVNTDNGKVEVLGTSFTVDTRNKESFSVQCITGKVRVTGGNNTKNCEAILTKNNKATYTMQSNQIEVRSFAIADAGMKIPVRTMQFNNKTLAEIIERIEYSYDVTIQVENEDLLATKYSTTIYDSTIGDFLNELEITYKVEVIQTASSNYILKGGTSN